MKQSMMVLGFSFLLLTLVLSGCGQTVTTTPTHPVSSTPTKTVALHSGGGRVPPCSTPVNTGLSYDAGSYTRDGDPNHPEDGGFGFFGNPSTNAPALGALRCVDDGGRIDLFAGNTTANYYHIRVTVNGVTTQQLVTSPSIDRAYANYNILTLSGTYPTPTDHQYTFQLQSCTYLGPCSTWSPHLVLTVVTNATCKSGYVWRAATSFDHVCVTPGERAQVDDDNTQANVRVNPNGAYGPLTCINGYVWRNAFGGDGVCVTPDQRSQVQYDNSQAFTRVVAF